ncbi:glycosyl transferase [Amycolatopsis antarctica]|uniref:Glycosyl transferase n=2 Tax=Amycolatopsis antarctica TaxID=1854586 RepID=A0A263D4E2_9PSEU|nr:glycosyl transferase [Amycolatopsis antarctica]
MTESTIAAGREFGADLVVHTSDHEAGALAARALGVPVLELGNRISWSMRDQDFRDGRGGLVDEEIIRALRAELSIPDGPPEVIARIDPRAPSMGGLRADEPDPRDGAPWWPMRYVPYNGGTVLPGWLRDAPERPRVGVTLGTVVPAMSGTSDLAVTIEALGGMDVDVVLAAGEADLSGLGTLPGNVRPAGFLPLSALLPTCALLVHHGGSGTTAAPLFYGVPQLVFPAFADNPMSAERVVRRGVGLSHDPSTVDVEMVRLLAGRVLTEPSFARAAREVSAEMAAQPSPATIIERLVAVT